jgi:membrane-associated protein
MILNLLNPLLNLHGWEAYALVGALVFAEAGILIGFVFPGETAVILGGVAASRGHIEIAALIVVVVVCAVAGDSVGYLVGQRWGRRLLGVRLLRRRRKERDEQRALTPDPRAPTDPRT